MDKNATVINDASNKGQHKQQYPFKKSMMSKIHKPKTINEVVTIFFIKTLSTSIGESEYEFLNEMIHSLYSNATTLLTTLSGEKYGHVGLIMKDTMYVILAMITLWEDPDEPGSSLIIATNAAVSHFQQANKTYNKACQIFENAANMDVALKHQIIETIEEYYFVELRKNAQG